MTIDMQQFYPNSLRHAEPETKKTKKRTYDKLTRQQAAALAFQRGTEFASQQFGVKIERIRAWCSQEKKRQAKKRVAAPKAPATSQTMAAPVQGLSFTYKGVSIACENIDVLTTLVKKLTA